MTHLTSRTNQTIWEVKLLVAIATLWVFSLGVFFGVFAIILILTYVSNMCNLLRSADNPALPHTIPADISTDDNSTSMGLGLDNTTLIACPKFLYSDIGKLLDGGSTVSGCSICLANYKSADVIRLLPDCGHLFHLQCIDTWLRVHPTCPICRNSPTATPLATSLAQVAPLATV